MRGGCFFLSLFPPGWSIRAAKASSPEDFVSVRSVRLYANWGGAIQRSRALHSTAVVLQSIPIVLRPRPSSSILHTVQQSRLFLPLHIVAMAPWFHRQQGGSKLARQQQPPHQLSADVDLYEDDRTPIPMMEEPTIGVGMSAAADDMMLSMRPSILEFRSSRFTRVNQQRQQLLQAMADAANAAISTKPKEEKPQYSDDDARSTTSSTRTTEKTTQDEDEDDATERDHGFTTDDDDGDDSESNAESDDVFTVADAPRWLQQPRPSSRPSRRRHHRRGTYTHQNAESAALENAGSSADYADSEDEYDDDDDLLTLMPMPASQEVPLLEGVPEDDENEMDVILCDTSRLPRTMVVDEDGFQISRESLMVSAARLDRTSTIKSGLLFKQGFGLLSGGWKVRHVTLTSAKMTFYREENGRKRGEIDLAQCTTKSIEIMPRDSVYDGSHATVWRFAIRGKGGRRVLLAAYSEVEMKEWLRCLHVALAVQGTGVGRFTDFVVPSGTFLADKNDGLMRSSANFR